MMMRLGVVMLAAVIASGCAGMNTGGGTTPDENAITSAGDLGAVACLALVVEAKPKVVRQVRDAVTKAAGVLNSPEPITTVVLERALDELDPRWQNVVRTLMSRIRARVGTIGDGLDSVIPRDSVPFQMAAAFVTECGAVLGAGE